MVVRPSVEDSNLVRQWVSEQAQKSIAAQRISTEEQREWGTIEVTISGDITDYAVTLEVKPTDPKATPPLKSTLMSCKCTNEQLIDRVGQEVTATIHKLRSQPKVVEAPEVDVFEVPVSSRTRPWTGYGKAGLALIPIGGAASITGAVLLGISGQNESLVVPGAVLLGIGVPVLIAGAVMVGVDRSSARRARMRPVPTASRHGAGVMFVGRF